MPLFEYKCGKCGKLTEFLESARGGKKHLCQHCGSSDMQKQFSTFAVGVRQDGTDSKCQSCTDHSCPHSMN
ncbi:MAG: FmdB family zinc ribbon protein [Planctomycetota bacterium]